MLRRLCLSLLCLTVLQTKQERGRLILTKRCWRPLPTYGIVFVRLLRSNKSRVFACVPVCCQTQALDCVCLECFPGAPWFREMFFCLNRIWTARFAHSLCRYVSVRLYVEKRHDIKYKRVVFSFDFIDVQFRENIYFVSSTFENSGFSVWFSWSISIIFEHVQISKRRRRPLNVCVQKSNVFPWFSWRSVSRTFISSHRSSFLTDYSRQIIRGRYVSVWRCVEKRHEIKYKRTLSPFVFLDVQNR